VHAADWGWDVACETLLSVSRETESGRAAPAWGFGGLSGAERALVAHFERRRITHAMLRLMAEGAAGRGGEWQLGGLMDPVAEWGWTLVPDRVVGGKLVGGSSWAPSGAGDAGNLIMIRTEAVTEIALYVSVD
jgi:hypothetical protein